jgi:hypothetical protein
MRSYGQSIGFLALILFLVPISGAQEEKKDLEKKDDAKAAPEKKSGLPEKKKEPAEEKLIYGYKFGSVKLVRIDGGEFAIDVPVPDPMKIYQLQMWSAQQMQSIMRQTNPIQATQQMAQYQVQLAQKQAKETTTNKTLEVRTADGMKVRTYFPPVAFDDQGNIKRYTAKQLIALRGKSKWPGYYPADAEILKVGQVVDVYISKASLPMPVKGAAKKRGDLEAEAATAGMKPEAVLIVVVQEPYSK